MADIFDPSSWSFPSIGSKEPTVKTTPKTGRVIGEAERLAEDLAQISVANSNADALALLTVSRDRGNDLTENNQLIQDYEKLTPVEFQSRYGLDVYDKLVVAGIGGQHVRDLAATTRGNGDKAADITMDIGSGLGQGVLGLTGMVYQAVPGPVGDFMSEKNAKGAEWLAEQTSDLKTQGDKRLDYVHALRTQLDQMDNAEILKNDVSNDTGFVDTLSSYGSDILRGGADMGKRFIEDPSRLGSGVSQGVGSVLAGSAASRLIGAGASTANRAVAPGMSSTAARTVDEAIEKVAFPMTIGAMEGGGAANSSIQEIMAIPDTELIELPRFKELAEEASAKGYTIEPDYARSLMAAEASAIASSIAAPVGAATGMLVSKFEKNPFAVTTPSKVVANSAREFVEEGVQSSVGELAVNIGGRVSGADPEGNLVEGVGSAAVEGALAGAGTPAATQGPSAALGTVAKAAGISLKYALDTAVKRGEEVLARNARSSSVSEENMAPLAEAATEQAPAVAASLRAVAQENGATGQEVEDYIARVEKAAQTQPEDIEGLPVSLVQRMQEIASNIGRLPNRFESLAIMASVAMDENAPQEDRVASGAFILKHIENNKKLFKDDFPAFLDNVPHDREEFKNFEGYAGILSEIEQTPSIQKALGWARSEMQMPDQDLTGVDLNSPEGQQIVNNMVNVATFAPQAVNAKVAEQILYQADEGTLQLSPEHRRILRGATSLLDSARLYAAQSRVMEPDVLEDQSEELQEELDETENRDEQMRFVNEQIKTEGGTKAHQTSLRDHLTGINQAVNQGDMKTARRKAQRLAMFAKSHINKVAAINQSIKNGNGQNVEYQALSASDEFYLEKKGAGVRVGNPGSERFGRTVHAEAMAIAKLANDIAAQYPEFGLRQVKVPGLLLDNQDNIIEDNKRGSSATPEKSVPPQATTSRTDTDTTQKKELPLPTPDKERVAEATPLSEEVVAVDTTVQVENSSSDPVKSEQVTEETKTEETTLDETTSDQDILELIESMEDAPTTGVTIKEVFPNLVHADGKNWFHKAFVLPKKQISRLIQMEQPLLDLFNLLGRPAEDIIAFMGGKDTKYDVGTNDRQALQALIRLGNDALNHMKARLTEKLTEEKTNQKTGKTQKSIGTQLTESGEALRFRDLRAFNILVPAKNKSGFRYDPQLIQSAMVAGLDWVLNADSRSVPMTTAEVAKLMGVSEADAAQYVEKFQNGMSLDMAARALGEQIIKFWGVKKNSDARAAYADGIPEAVGKEVLKGLEEAGLIQMETIQAPEITNKTFNRVLFNQRSEDIQTLMGNLNGVATLIGDMVLIDKPKEGYSIGEPITEVDDTQLRNSMVKLTPQNKKALANGQQTPYLPVDVNFDFFEALGLENFVTIMSEHAYENGDLDKDHNQRGFNKGDWGSVKGLQRSLVSSFQNVSKHMAQVKKHGDNVATFYKHHINKLGRPQMDGLSNPQTDKLARHIFMSTGSKLDLSEPESLDHSRFMLMIAQGIGEKTEKAPRAVSVKAVNDRVFSEDGDLHSLVLDMKTWLTSRDNGKKSTLPDTILDKLKAAKLSVHGQISLIEAARYELAQETGQDLSSFQSNNYLEADGKTNGPINALMLWTSGPITPDWLRQIGKGGVYFGSRGKTLNSHMTQDSEDLYADTSVSTQSKVVELGNKLQTNEAASEMFTRFQQFLAALSVDVKIVDGKTVILRGLAKNPLTITVYGSGVTGIAGNITDELVKIIYQNWTESIQTGVPAGNLIYPDSPGAFMEDLQNLTSKAVRFNRKNGEYFVVEQENPIRGSAQDFELNREQYKTLRDNVKMFLVDPMREAINEKVSKHVNKTTETIQRATQLQSIILKGMFMREIAARIALMKSDPEKYDYKDGELFSDNELKDIRNNLLPFSPVINTKTQGYFLAGGETSDLLNLKDETGKDIPIVFKGPEGQDHKITLPESLSRSITGDMSTPAYVYGVTTAGVSSAPTLTIGSGDAQMMMNFLSENPEETKRITHVFDGLNMPGDMIEDYSQLINQSVFQTWTNNDNPVRAVADSFAAFMRNSPIEEFFPEGEVNSFQDVALTEIAQSFYGKFDLKDDEKIDPTDAKIYFEQTLSDLNDVANETDARRQTYAAFDLSVDQMASGENPFTNVGQRQLGPDEDIADAMNDFYVEKLAELSGNKVAEKVSVVPDNQAEVQLIQGDGSLGELGRKLAEVTTSTQTEMAKAAINSLLGSDYKVVLGTTSQLDEWEQANNADRFVPGSNDHYGKIDPVSKIILVSNTTAETIIHELVHAATLTKVQAAYTNPKALSKEDREAVARIEGLMNEWLQQDFGNEDAAGQDARRQAESTISRYLDPKNPRPAEALNEFMAWVLSNQALSEIAAKTKVKNPLFRIIGEALAALKSLIWGGKDKGPRVGDSILSNLRFNTRVLMATPTAVDLLKQDFAAVTLHQSRGFGSSNRLTAIRERFNSKVVSWINEASNSALETLNRKYSRQNLVNKAGQAAEDITRSFAYHFTGLQDMQAWSTFSMIQKAMMTEIELNPNSLSRMEDIYTHVMREIEVSHFRKNTNPDDQNDVYQAQQKYNALEGLYVTKNDEQGRSSLMSSFLALAMVDDSFRKILSEMDKPKSDKDDSKTLDAMLENMGNASLDRLSIFMAGEKGSDNNVRDALDRLTVHMIENVGDQRSHIEQSSENYIDRLENSVADFIQDKSEEIGKKSGELIRTSNNRAVKAGASVVNLAATMINEKSAKEAALGVTRWFSRRDNFKTIGELVNDVVGATQENLPVYSMISKVRAQVQQTRQQFREELPIKLASMFSKAPSKKQWTAMFKSLGKTDLASLIGKFGVTGALELISTPDRLAFETKTLEATIKSLDSKNHVLLKAKSAQLAHYMMTGEQGSNLLRNAEAISRLLGEQGVGSSTSPAPQLVEAIDRLVTLYAVGELDQDTIDTVIDLGKDDKDKAGLEFVTNYLAGQRAEELGKIGSNVVAKLNHYKGHIPSEAKQGGSLIIASESEHGHLLSRGYTKVSEYTGSSADRVLGKRSYYFAPVSGTSQFNQGVLQTVHQTVSGIDPESGYTVGEVMAGRIDDIQLVRLTQRQLANQRQTSENLLPVFDDAGKLVAYERAADPKKLENLNRSTDLAEMIGVWRGRQVEELLAQKVNEKLIDNLYGIWEKDLKAGRQKEYVNIASLGLSHKDDRILQEAARLIPNQSRDYIKEVFGRGTFMVRRDMLLDTFGARQASVGDLFTGKTRWDPRITDKFEKIAMSIAGNKAYPWLVSGEKSIQEFVTTAKFLIVVKSVVVPTANIVSNMFQLMNRGVPLRMILKGFPAKTAEINSYIKRRNREVDLEADLRSAKGKNSLVEIRKLENEIQSIKDSYRRMSIWPLIEAGEFSAISSGHITAEDLALAEGKWTNWTETQINKLPGGFKTTARYALITRDTALFQGLARSVQYGDFIAKAVLYDDLVNRKKATRDEALLTVNEAFVNYNRLAGRSRQYLESIGLLWFYNYKIRIMKEAAYMLRHNPLRSLLMTAIPVGAPISDNLATMIFDDKLGYSMGPNMGLNSFNLHPWINWTR